MAGHLGDLSAMPKVLSLSYIGHLVLPHLILEQVDIIVDLKDGRCL